MFSIFVIYLVGLVKFKIKDSADPPSWFISDAVSADLLDLDIHKICNPFLANSNADALLMPLPAPVTITYSVPLFLKFNVIPSYFY